MRQPLAHFHHNRSSHLSDRTLDALVASHLSDEELDQALRTVPKWKYDAAEKRLIRATKRQSFSDGIDLVRDVAELAEDLQHHPDIDIRWTTITFSLTTHSAGGLTLKDFELAKEIDGLLD